MALVLRPGENVDIVFRGSSHNVAISHGEEGPHRHSRYGNGLNDLAVLAAEDFDAEVFPAGCHIAVREGGHRIDVVLLPMAEKHLRIPLATFRHLEKKVSVQPKLWYAKYMKVHRVLRPVSITGVEVAKPKDKVKWISA